MLLSSVFKCLKLFLGVLYFGRFVCVKKVLTNPGVPEVSGPIEIRMCAISVLSVCLGALSTSTLIPPEQGC